MFWNWNPSFSRDAYTILQSVSQVPRLRPRAMRWVMTILFKWESSEPVTRHERKWFIVYGVLAWIYPLGHWYVLRVTFIESLFQRFQGWALLLIAVFAWWRFVPRQSVKRPVYRYLLASEARLRVKVAVRLALLVAVLVVMFLPYRYETGGAFKILPVKRTEVHIEIEGAPIQVVPIREGQWVKEGDLLAKVDPRSFQKNVDTIQAELASTTAQLNLLRKQVAILTNPPNLEEIQRLEADVRRLGVELANAHREVELTVLRAPVEGKVVTPYVDQRVGQFLKKGDLLATIQDARTVEVEIQVPEGDIPEVKKGARARMAAWSYPNTTFTGHVLSVGTVATLDPIYQIMVVRVVVQIPNPDDLLKADMTGYAKIEAGTKPMWDVLSRRLLRWIKIEVWSWVP
jgi:multidrug efflux pump subunit AcrA (membrane-fusion protein)